jgi:hypothetical protein
MSEYTSSTVIWQQQTVQQDNTTMGGDVMSNAGYDGWQNDYFDPEPPELDDSSDEALRAENEELKRELHVWRVLVTTCMLQDFWDRGIRGADLTPEKLNKYMQDRMNVAYDAGGFGEYDGISDPDDDSVDALDADMIAMEKTVNRVCVQLHLPEFEISYDDGDES